VPEGRELQALDMQFSGPPSTTDSTAWSSEQAHSDQELGTPHAHAQCC